MDISVSAIADLSCNWDGYDGCTFLPETLANAERVLSALRSAGLDVDVSPNPNGTVMFDFGFGAIEVGKTRGVGYVKQGT